MKLSYSAVACEFYGFATDGLISQTLTRAAEFDTSLLSFINQLPGVVPPPAIVALRTVNYKKKWIADLNHELRLKSVVFNLSGNILKQAVIYAFVFFPFGTFTSRLTAPFLALKKYMINFLARWK
jgi:hypothetical protein